MGFKTTALIATVSVLLSTAPAFATTFTFDKSSGLSGSQGAGVTKSILTSYDNNTDEFTWSSTFEKKNGILADGLWGVLNNGSNPKGTGGELAIFFADGTKGITSFFEYNGKNNIDSLTKPGRYLGQTALLSTDTTVGDKLQRNFSFNIDATDINNASTNLKGKILEDWKGIQFDRNIGLWVHGVAGLNTEYDEDGKLTQFAYTSDSWYDVADEQATAVPEPASAAALGLFAVAGAFVKRSKQSA